MMRIDEIWEELECESGFSKGLLLRRYSGAVLPDLFIAVLAPERQRCLAVSLSSISQFDLGAFDNLKVIQITTANVDSLPDRQLVLIKLVDNQIKDIFSVLCEDLVVSVQTIDTEQKLVQSILNRFVKWKALFESAQGIGLTSEAQRGLFGELYLLRLMLNQSYNPFNCIRAWVGPEKQVRDFQYEDWAIEVKTSQGNNHQKIQISNERQLDTSAIGSLYLFHLSLDVKNKSGESLNHVVKNICSFLAEDYYSLLQFQNKLLEVGYYHSHFHMYEDTGYEIRNESLFKVEGNFPRLQESDIRHGVGDVKYSIIIANCDEYKLELSQLFDTINLS